MDKTFLTIWVCVLVEYNLLEDIDKYSLNILRKDFLLQIQ